MLFALLLFTNSNNASAFSVAKGEFGKAATLFGCQYIYHVYDATGTERYVVVGHGETCAEAQAHAQATIAALSDAGMIN